MDAEHWDRLGALHTRVEQELAKALHQHHSIGLSEYRALARLADADDGELRMQELADLIGLNQSSVSRLASRLESSGLTRRDLCPDDRRGVYSVITDEGRDVQRQARPTYDSALRAALDAAAADGHLGPLVATLRS
ncbi:MarR family transcriptional regulator [Streptomyces sp. Je 1-4]|uniref:MarR family winged helix-turn-helix transcriptional regulator n=1 Tax=Streptomyces TaxID=1883 RepID=UPI00140F0BBA|nr:MULTISPECIES: MarR family transcriptional regulator [unclassified Streptomyces]QIK06331.1 MarR family transcriptional regulator [Streptomyces sp. ID38640]UYB39679.1 MarR family transcriptional regulator [Streptomyces sp. Je 1-4]UZQ35723.1 MarR family transcriptional regulator [Streptomyces sp. Je 1-4] [Streptomyces sp. Je 1-4 4N24]UZQ43141.1 MarR family transcriptional regulator [Streptomyces sp. Je 1-4] [Streptomyces sp. Je 1-4 4N24_ara]